MRTDELWSEVHINHGDKICDLLDKVPENGKITYASTHNGVWYFYSVDKDHTISIINAIRGGNNTRAGKAKEIKVNKLLKEYGLDSNTGGVRHSLQANENGGDGRVLGNGSNSSNRQGFDGTNTVQSREGQSQQFSDALRADEQNNGGDVASNKGADTRVDSGSELRMRVRMATNSGKSLREQVRTYYCNNPMRISEDKTLASAFFKYLMTFACS